MRVPRRGWLGVAVAGTLPASGCMSPLYRSTDETRLTDSGRYHIVDGLDVPAVRGPDGCGAQALATVLAHEDAALDAGEVADALPWHDVGATPVDLLLAARDRGFEAGIARGTWGAVVESALQDRPLLVMVDARPEFRTLLFRIPGRTLMHWSVVSGIARDGSRVLLAARDRRHHVVERDDFLDRWSRSDYCAITITGPPCKE